MLRVLSSRATFPAEGGSVTSQIENLTEVCVPKARLEPKRITLVGDVPRQVCVSEVRLQAPDAPQDAHRLYAGPPVPLRDVMRFLDPGAMELTPKAFHPTPGMELVFEAAPMDVTFEATFLWGINNDDPVEISATELCQLYANGDVDGNARVQLPAGTTVDTGDDGSDDDGSDDGGGAQTIKIKNLCKKISGGSVSGGGIIIVDPSILPPGYVIGGGGGTIP